MNPARWFQAITSRLKPLLNSDAKQKLITGGAITAVSRFAAIAFLIVSNGLVTRLVKDQAEAGIYFTMWSAATFLCAMGQLGLRIAIVPWIAEGVESKDLATVRASIRTTVQLVHISFFLISLALMAIFQICATWFNFRVLNFEQILLFALWIFTIGTAYSLPEIFRGFHRYFSSAFLGGLFTSLLNTCCLSLLWYRGMTADITVVLRIMVLSGMLNYGVIMYFIWLQIKPLPKHGHFPFRSALSRALPMMVANSSIVALEVLDTVLVGTLAGPAQASLYGPASRLATLIYMPFQIMSSTISPVVASAIASKDKSRLQNILQGASTIAALPGWICVIIYIIFGRQLLAIGFGPEYAAAAPILIALSIGNGMLLLNGSAALALLFGNYQSVVMKINALVTLIALVLIAVLALWKGAIAVALAKASAVFLISLLNYLACRNLLGVSSCATLKFRKVLSAEEKAV